MKKTILKTALFAAIAAATLAAGSRQRLEVNIPFAFSVGSVTLPAGAYVIDQYGPAGVLMITSLERHGSAVVMTRPAINQTGSKSAVTFEKRNGQTVLSGVWLGDADGRQVEFGK